MEVVLALMVLGIFGLVFLLDKITELVKQFKSDNSHRLLGSGRTLRFTGEVSLKDKNKEVCATQRKPQNGID